MEPDTTFERTFLNRRSVRAYEDRPVPPDIRDLVLTAALRAPTAGNLCLYTILEIEDPSLKARLSETCDHQPFIAGAPWVLVFLADWARLLGYFRHPGGPEWCATRGEPYLRPRESDVLLAVCHALVAAQSAASAAEALGLGTCYIGDILENGEIHRELLGLPPYAFPITMLCLGWPTDRQKERPQPPRLPRDLVVHRDRYRGFTAGDYDRMFAGKDWPEPRRDPAGDNPGISLYSRKFAAAYSLEMRRSVRALLEEWR